MNVRGKVQHRRLHARPPRPRVRSVDRRQVSFQPPSMLMFSSRNEYRGGMNNLNPSAMKLMGLGAPMPQGAPNGKVNNNNHIGQNGQGSPPVRQASTDSAGSNQSSPHKLVRVMDSHQYLIIICVLVVLDAAMTICQLMIDLYIIRERFAQAEASLSTLSEILSDKYPQLHDYHVTDIEDLILAVTRHVNPNFLSSQNDPMTSSNDSRTHTLDRRKRSGGPAPMQSNCNCVNETCECVTVPHGGGHHSQVHLFIEIAHLLHLASLGILVLFAIEKLIKAVLQGRAFVRKKMEVFDTFVVLLSLILDVIFLQGIWSQTQKDAALFLVCLLPWRIIRILNCFVMTMKQRHHIRMQLQKHARRKAQKKVYLCKRHVERLRRQIKSLKGLCRKHGAEEREINACAFVFTESRRRKSSLPVNAMSTMASIALIGVIGNDPHMPLRQNSEEELHTLAEQDEDELDEMTDIMPEYNMNGSCHRPDSRKVSVISAADSVEISCNSVSAGSENASPVFDRRFSEDTDCMIDFSNISDDSPNYSDDSDGGTRDDKILKSRRFSTHDFLNKKKPSVKKKRGK